jgi:hypothetical protein
MARAHHRRHHHRHHRRHNPRRRRSYVHFGHNPRRYFRMNRSHRRRRNPILGMSTSDMLNLAGGAVVGGIVTRWAPQTFLSASNQGLMGYAANGATAVIGGWLVSKLSPRWGQGFVIGGLAALAMRVVTDYFGPQVSALTGGGVSGDLDFDLGFYLQNSFPLPTTGTGPWLLQPGVTASPVASGGLAPAAPVVVSTPSGPQAVHPAVAAAMAQGAAAPSGGAPSGDGSGAGVGRWQNRWAA